MIINLINAGTSIEFQCTWSSVSKYSETENLIKDVIHAKDFKASTNASTEHACVL